MEIGVSVFLLLVCVSILWGESTKTGDRFIKWIGKTFCGVELED
jgi:hypothetical protein